MTRTTKQKKPPTLERLSLAGLEHAPSQLWGRVRLVPLVRPTPIADLRLGLRAYGDEVGVVRVDETKHYATTFLPHGMVVRWTEDGAPVAGFETTLSDGTSKAVDGHARGGVRLLHRMVKRTGDTSLRLLPLHLAMEGFLARWLGGPDVERPEWSREVLRHGLSAWTWSYQGEAVPDLEEALRRFEIVDGQCGVLVFIADALASAFVVPHPADYRALHASLLLDFYAPVLLDYAWAHPRPPEWSLRLDEATDLDGIARALEAAAAEQRAFELELMAGQLFDRRLDATRAYTLRRFALHRFVTVHRGLPKRLQDEDHMGEAIVTDRGELAYLKTYRMDPEQRRRFAVLKVLAEGDWALAAARTPLGLGTDRQVERELVRLGLGWTLRKKP